MNPSDLICGECGEVLTKSPSGAVCFNGHGRIRLGVTGSQLQKVREYQWAASLPAVRREGKKIVHDGKEWEVQVTRPGSASYEASRKVFPFAKASAGCIIARVVGGPHGYKIRELKQKDADK